jgi:hypothetical protein
LKKPKYNYIISTRVFCNTNGAKFDKDCVDEDIVYNSERRCTPAVEGLLQSFTDFFDAVVECFNDILDFFTSIGEFFTNLFNFIGDCLNPGANATTVGPSDFPAITAGPEEDEQSFLAKVFRKRKREFETEP